MEDDHRPADSPARRSARMLPSFSGGGDAAPHVRPRVAAGQASSPQATGLNHLDIGPMALPSSPAHHGAPESDAAPLVLLAEIARSQDELLKEIRCLGARLAILEQGTQIVPPPRPHFGDAPDTPLSTSTRLNFLPSMEDKAIISAMSRPACAQVHIMQLWSFFTVYAFTSAAPSLFGWIPEPTRLSCTSLFPRIDAVSGISLQFFSVRMNEVKTPYESGIGAVWVHCIKSIISAVISATKTDLLAEQSVAFPDWLHAFGDEAETMRIVKERLHRFRSFCGASADSPAEKRHKSDLKTRDVLQDVIMAMRRSLLSFLTYNRRMGKLTLYKSLLFLVERIKTFSTPEEARSNGFYFELTTPSQMEELPSGPLPDDSPWRIQNAFRDDFAKSASSVDDRNDNLVDMLIRNFPSLTVKAHWFKVVRRTVNDRNQDHPHYKNPNLTRICSETISLHLVARAVLADLIRRKTHQKVLRCSNYSPMCVHVYALALRGLISESMGNTLSEAESLALGNLRAEPRRADDHEFVTALLAGTRIPFANRSRPVASTGSRDSASPSPRAASPKRSASKAFGADTPQQEDREEVSNERRARMEMSWSQYLDDISKPVQPGDFETFLPDANLVQGSQDARESNADQSSSMLGTPLRGDDVRQMFAGIR